MNRIPVREECLKILKYHNVPENIIKHSLKVTEFAIDIARKLEKRGIRIDKDLLRAAAMLHDITRAEPGDHVLSGSKLLKNLGFKDVSEVTRTHGLYHLPHINPETIEQKILFYADKRVIEDKIATLKQRFEDFKKRYPHVDEGIRKYEYNYLKELEKELGL